MSTLLSILDGAASKPDAGITFFERGETDLLPYSLLARQTPYRAAIFARAGVKAGTPVLFQITRNRPLVEAFWACAWLGAVPVMVPPALTAADRGRVLAAIEMFPGCVLLTDERTAPHVLGSDAILLNVDELLGQYDEKSAAPAHPLEPNDIALVQMSSGSTGTPKGVIVEDELLAAAMRATIPQHPEQCQNSMLTWLPLTHNLSLLGFHVYAMFRGYPQVLMPTSDFITDPRTWLCAITQFRPTVTVCPNFGFHHILRFLKMRPIGPDDGYDLSSVRKLISASEPINAQTARNFRDAMMPLGLIENALVGAYGMSEACLVITTTDIYEPLHTVTLDRDRVRIGETYDAIATSEGAEFVSVGKAVPGMEVTLRDADSKVLGEETVGEVFCAGVSMTHACITSQGPLPHALSADGAMGTGDIGIVHDGELYIVGRKKDIIFVNGKNYFSPDLEKIIEESLECEAVVLGRTEDTGEAIVVFLPDSATEITDAQIAGTLMQTAGVPVSQVIRVPQIPRAANGKKNRRECEVLL